MTHIQLQNVSKSFGAVDVIRNVSLDIPDGEFVILVGPSGCGKSTLLRMIAGLEDISAGQVIIGGKLANAIPAKQRNLAMVFQSYALYPHMKVADNMSFALKLAGVPKAEIAARVANAAEILGLGDLLGRLPRELSGGQRQRVAMGRAIVRNPEAFLFDEPLSNLDAKLRVKMRSEIKKLHKRLAKTMVYVTHDQTEAMTMADTIVVLNDGGIAQTGTPDQVYRDPDNIFVASFIGSPEINLLAAKCAGPKALHVQMDDGTRLPLAAPLRLPEGAPVVYGIRPQNIELIESGLPAEVTLTEPTGENIELRLQLGGHDLVAVVPDQPGLSPGRKVQVLPDVLRVLLFDPATGLRLR